MKIYLNENLNIKNVEDETIYESGSDNSIELLIPKSVVNDFFPSANFMRADGRKFGPLMSTSQINEDDYSCYIWHLAKSLTAVVGPLQITFKLNYLNSNNNVFKIKDIAMCFVDVYEQENSEDVVIE